MDRAQNQDKELENVRRIVGIFFDAWNRRDVPTLMSLFSEDAEVVNSLGLCSVHKTVGIEGEQCGAYFSRSFYRHFSCVMRQALNPSPLQQT